MPLGWLFAVEAERSIYATLAFALVQAVPLPLDQLVGRASPEPARTDWFGNIKPSTASLSGEIVWQMRAFLTPRHAYLLLAACPNERADRIEAARQALDAVQFTSLPSAGRPSNTDRERGKTAHFYNELALHFYYREEWDRGDRHGRAAPIGAL